MSTAEPAIRPEVHAALALAARHLRAAEDWRRRLRSWERGRLVIKHRDKARKHMARAAKYSAKGRGGELD